MLENAKFALSSEARDHLEKIKSTDVLVGIPSYNNVLTASYVVSQVVKGLDNYFPLLRAAIFVSDGNSVDGTLKSVKTVHLPCKRDVSCNINLIPAIYIGISGKGTAIKAIFEASKLLDAKAVALVDSDLRSITPEWMKLLLGPALSGTDLVVPLYSRSKYDGTITNFLCYPVTASLYGRNVRQPIGGDFGLSSALIDELLASRLWGMPEVCEFGVDIFETHTALGKGFEVKQAFLGAKDHDPKDPTLQLTSMFKQVVTTMFTCVEEYENSWRTQANVSELETVGEEKQVNSEKAVPIDLQKMINTYKESYNTYRSVCQSVLNKDLLDEYEKLLRLDNSQAAFPKEKWAKTVYNFITAFHRKEPSDREILIDALRVLWTGRLAAFIQETLSLSAEETESKVIEQAKTFQELKSYLMDIF